MTLNPLDQEALLYGMMRIIGLARSDNTAVEVTESAAFDLPCLSWILEPSIGEEGLGVGRPAVTGVCSMIQVST